MNRRLYSLLVVCLLPLALVYLLWRGRKQPEYRQHWGERFARYPRQNSAAVGRRFLIWIHAVSVGETRAAQPLVAALRARYPTAAILFSHTTPTGRATSEALFGDSVERCYLPYDTPWAVRRFLTHYQPSLALIMETELWPNLLSATRHAGIPALLINARLSERSAKGYARFSQLSRETLASLTTVAAQSAQDAKRLSELGGKLGATHVKVTGNIKFDMTPPDALLSLGERMKERMPGRAVWLCASTREGEEALILDAWQKKVSRCDTTLPAGAPLLVIVPRHPQRFSDVATLASSYGLTVQRRSEDAVIDPATQVVIGDSMGEMFAYYAAADVVFVGGSLLDFGCQNLIEPCSIGAPVLLGPSTYNFAEAAREALASKAAIQVNDATALVAEALQLLNDAPRRRALGAAGIAFTQKHRGATARTMALIEDAMAGGK